MRKTSLDPAWFHGLKRTMERMPGLADAIFFSVKDKGLKLGFTKLAEMDKGWFELTPTHCCPADDDATTPLVSPVGSTTTLFLDLFTAFHWPIHDAFPCYFHCRAILIHCTLLIVHHRKEAPFSCHRWREQPHAQTTSSCRRHRRWAQHAWYLAQQAQTASSRRQRPHDPAQGAVA